ncbi:hypothetical protein HHI36_022974 [Cryptolaemus montrouzieri]|uniref:Kinesin motor domain-containing protein n=1 Tax=Cryptolaemus montrouzieri TaxID=559131 RepID=A0ABD2PFN3_9CUCU
MSLDNITVAVRARPLLTSESKFIPWVIENNSIQQIDEDKVLIGETYVYDEIFDVNKKNEDIYNTTIAPMVRSAIEGINLTVFAYGATSSGKTYTMNGTRRDPGVMPRIIEDIFNQIQMCNQRKFLLRVSYVEIYSEVINDLLDKNNKDLKIREDFNNCVNYNPTEK